MATQRVIAQADHKPLRDAEEDHEVAVFLKRLSIHPRRASSRPYHCPSDTLKRRLQEACADVDGVHYKIVATVIGSTIRYDAVRQ